MTNEALNEIKRARAKIAKAGQIGDIDIVGWAELGVAAEALDKQIPDKPIEEVDDFGDRHVCCPTCIGPVTNYWAPGTRPKHCQFCGQALDWGKEAET